MPRTTRRCQPDTVYHLLNRANARLPLFETDRDYAAFETVLEQAQERFAMRLLAYVVMPSHWHLVVWPRREDEVSQLMAWVTLTHTRRWQLAHDAVGSGHLYQGRFKSFPVQDDGHLMAVCRYVERNPLRAGLVARAEDWRWSSFWRRTAGDESARPLLAAGPRPIPADWLAHVNRAETDEELAALRLSAQRGRPFGGPEWVAATAQRLGLESTLRSRGRPRKAENLT
jgi:putative transposase